MNNFANNLKYYRELTSRTQREMAELLNMTVNAYQQYEYGKREPRLSVLIEISDILNVSLDELVKKIHS